VTAGAAAWYFLVASSSPPSGEFAVARDKYADAATALTDAAETTNRLLDFPEFNVVWVASVNTMESERDVFRRLANQEEGEAAQIATNAANAATLGITSANAFRYALSKTRIDDANGARDQLESAVADLTRQAKAWQRL
jgi:hypothetical protein